MPVFIAPFISNLLHRCILLRRRLSADCGIIKTLLSRNALPHRGELLLLAVEIGDEPFRALFLRQRADIAHFRIVRKLLDADVLPHNGSAVAAPADVALLAMEAGMLFAIRRIGTIALEF